jgi:hypothetical protein
MRSLEQIMNLAQAEDFTKDKAAAIVKDQVEEMVTVLHYTEADAKAMLLHNLGYYAGYYTHAQADRVYEMFETEHPLWGRRHPTTEEILQMGIELGKRSTEKRMLQ